MGAWEGFGRPVALPPKSDARLSGNPQLVIGHIMLGQPLQNNRHGVGNDFAFIAAIGAQHFNNLGIGGLVWIGGVIMLGEGVIQIYHDLLHSVPVCLAEADFLQRFCQRSRTYRAPKPLRIFI